MGVGTSQEGKKRLHDLVDAIVLLKNHGLRGAGVIEAYNVRRVAPLMAHTLPLYRMTPGVQLDGTMLSQGPLHDSEVM